MCSLVVALCLAVASPAPAAPVAAAKAQQSDGSWTLSHEVVVKAPVAAVWEAISTAQGWKSWAVPVAWASDPDVIETSYSADALPGSPATIKQQVIARVAPRLMVFRTVKAPAGFPDFDTYTKVVSVFELRPADKGRTRVRLTGTGYADTEAGRKLLAFFEKGNAASLEWLRTRFNEGPKDWSKPAR
jgi:uncharacterized protein YndB with AHSA1/START domain